MYNAAFKTSEKTVNAKMRNFNKSKLEKAREKVISPSSSRE
jgi:hypothetical protein